MDDDRNSSVLGCVVCNPAQRRALEEVLAERRQEFARNLHIARFGSGFHILQAPGPDGEPFVALAGPLESEEAAELCREELICACNQGDPGSAYCSDELYDYFNLAGRILKILEGHKGNLRSLATELAHSQPWMTQTNGSSDEQPPF